MREPPTFLLGKRTERRAPWLETAEGFFAFVKKGVPGGRSKINGRLKYQANYQENPIQKVEQRDVL